MAGSYIGKYDTTAANNTATGTGSVSVAEGMLPSNVNNAMRDIMADIRQWYNSAEWIEYGDGAGTYTPAYASGTSFTIASANVTSVYHVGRRVKAVGSSTGTIYGSITATSFSTNTTVTISWDSGSLSSESLTIYIGITSATNTSMPETPSITGDYTLDVSGDIILDADGGDVFFKDGGTTFGSATNTSGNLIIKSGTTTAATFSGANVTLAGTVGSGAITSTGIVTGTGFTAGSAVLAEAELELLDGLTAGTAIASKVVTTDASIDTSGQRNLTITGELDAATLDISGNADIDGTTNLDAVDIDGAVQVDNTITVGADDQGYDVKLFGDTASAYMLWDTSADDLILGGAARIVVPDSGLVLGSTAVTSTAAEINLIDGGASTGTTAVADADGILTNDGGTMRLTTAATFKTYFTSGVSSAADDITIGDGAVTLSTSSGDITIDATANDTDIIFKGTDATADITMLTLDGSEAGKATFNSTIVADSKDVILGKSAGTNFTNSLLIGHATTGTLDDAQRNTGVGFGTLDALTSGDRNTALGYNAGTAITTALYNTFVGDSAGVTNVSGASNIGIGMGSLGLVQSGHRNTAVGFNAANAMTASDTTAIGYEALKVATGINNTAIGKDAGIAVVGGTYNIMVGFDAGDNITTGSGNIIIGTGDAAAVDSARTFKVISYDGSTTTNHIISDSSGNMTLAADLTIGDDLNLTTDSTVINFGADSDTTLTHTDGTGLTLNSTNKLCFQDTGTFINSNADGDLDLSSDGTAVDSVKIVSAGGITLDANNTGVSGLIRLDADYGGSIHFADGGTDFGQVYSQSSDMVIRSMVVDKDLILKGNDGGSTVAALTFDMSAAGAATFNDKVIATELDISGNMDIDGTSNLDAVDIDGAVQLDATLTIGANDQGYDVILYGDTASANVTWDTSADDLIFNGGAGLIVPDGQLTLGSTAVSSTAAELNLLDGSAKSTSSITVADADALIVIDGTTTKQIPASDMKTYIGGGTSWQAVKTGNFTAAAGQGVFCNTTSSAFTITLPAGTIGDEVSIIDYAGTFDSNNLTVAANGSEKIHASTDDLTVATERAAFTLVFTDSTQGWLLKDK